MAVLPETAEQAFATVALRVLIESPFSAPTKQQIRRNISYARACVRDSVLRGEAPWCSHLFYTQDGILDDTLAAERQRGIALGLSWGQAAQASAVYIDLGVSAGMTYGVAEALREGRPVVCRALPFNELARLKIKPLKLAEFPREIAHLPVDRLPAWPALSR